MDGSEPLIGFHMARALSNHAEIVVVTNNFFRPSIEDNGGLGRAEVAYIDQEAAWHRTGSFVAKLGLSAGFTTLVSLPQSLAFERAAWRRFRDELAEGRFDLVHRINPVSSAFPSAMANLSPVPFVVGPVNGGLPFPTQFRRELHQEREWLRYVRGAVRFIPSLRATYRKASAVLASGQHTIDTLPIRRRDNVFNLMEVGVDTERFQPPEARPIRERTTFLFVGRLVPFKCVRLAIDAFAASPTLRRHRFLILGVGPERAALEDQVRRLDLGATVEFLGQRPNHEIAALMWEADVFVFPSIRESGGLVVAEAMASGLACVVADHGGPSNILTDRAGIKIPIGEPDVVAARFRVALESLAEDHSLRDRLGRAARERILQHFTWEGKARKIVEVYRWVLGLRSDKPDLEAITEDAARNPT